MVRSREILKQTYLIQQSLRVIRKRSCNRYVVCVAMVVCMLADMGSFAVQGFRLSSTSRVKFPLSFRLFAEVSTTTDASSTASPRNEELSPSSGSDGGLRPCYYKPPGSKFWKERLELSNIKPGQELEAFAVVQDLLDGKTGPKLFLDCGVGRCRDLQTWKIQTAMLRIGKTGYKKTAAAKKAARLRKKAPFPVYVSRIRPDSDQFEVCLTPEDAAIARQAEPKRSLSTLQPGEELIGTVVRVEDYGVFMNVGANRNGLLHISKVADLYGKYIDKAAGLAEAGLGRGAHIKAQVLTNEKKRLFLDFTEDVKLEARQEQLREAQEVERKRLARASAPPPQTSAPVAPASSKLDFPAGENSDEEEEEEEEYDDEDYDEDRDIEDALGLGSY